MLSEEVYQDEERWSDVEISRFTSRVAGLKKRGLSEMSAEQLAEQMLYRDRPESGDDRRICMECKGLKGLVCAFAQSMGLRRGMEPVATVLQRCDGFLLKGSHAGEQKEQGQ